ncbi:hypothetical protein BLNAU_9945 [Blattamonas nauphoetae]|uniref:Uncharacterized protein n=1 Tax=Blattamonas nauphoetae TaxID=2049346 RepID=A0ABQ9XU52_9EUKA|nr:hypothetical protein BLNAU_9945 [Blattamonas nauphoetae]
MVSFARTIDIPSRQSHWMVATFSLLSISPCFCLFGHASILETSTPFPPKQPSFLIVVHLDTRPPFVIANTTHITRQPPDSNINIHPLSTTDKPKHSLILPNQSLLLLCPLSTVFRHRHSLRMACDLRLLPGGCLQREELWQELIRRNDRSHHALDDSLEAKAVKFLKSLDPDDEESTHAFLNSIGSNPDESSTVFVQSIVVLVSSTSKVLTAAVMKMMNTLFRHCSTKRRLALVKSTLIPQLVITLNPHSLSFTEAADIHTSLMGIVTRSFWLANPDNLGELGIEDDNEQQDVYETIFRQVLVPSEKYICHLCVNQYLFVDEDQSKFLTLLAALLEISPYYRPTMEVVLNMPVILTIPSCLAFFENDDSIWYFLSEMINAQWNWSNQGREGREMWKTVHRMLRMEGIEDVIENYRQNDRNGHCGGWIVVRSIEWNNGKGMNIPQRW